MRLGSRHEMTYLVQGHRFSSGCLVSLVTTMTRMIIVMHHHVSIVISIVISITIIINIILIIITTD